MYQLLKPFDKFSNLKNSYKKSFAITHHAKKITANSKNRKKRQVVLHKYSIGKLVPRIFVKFPGKHQ